MPEMNCWTVSGRTSRTASFPKNGVMYFRRWLRRFAWVDGLCWMSTRASHRFANSANIDEGLARYIGSFTTASLSSSLRLARRRVGRSPSFFSPRTSDLRTRRVWPFTISSSRHRPTQTVRSIVPSSALTTRVSRLPRWCLLRANKPPGSLTYCPWAPMLISGRVLCNHGPVLPFRFGIPRCPRGSRHTAGPARKAKTLVESFSLPLPIHKTLLESADARDARMRCESV